MVPRRIGVTTFKCQRCGWCCRNLPIAVSASDMTRWFNTARNDILKTVSFIANYPHKGTGGFYITQTTFNPKQPCPFLTSKNICKIHDVKPTCCRDFPVANQNPGECPNADGCFDQQLKKTQNRDFYVAFKNRNQFLGMLVLSRKET